MHNGFLCVENAVPLPHAHASCMHDQKLIKRETLTIEDEPETRWLFVSVASSFPVVVEVERALWSTQTRSYPFDG